VKAALAAIKAEISQNGFRVSKKGNRIGRLGGPDPPAALQSANAAHDGGPGAQLFKTREFQLSQDGCRPDNEESVVLPKLLKNEAGDGFEPAMSMQVRQDQRVKSDRSRLPGLLGRTIAK
jgi:hypothetical protein